MHAVKNPPNPDDPRFISAVSDVAERISRRLINDEDKLLKFGLPLVHQNDHTQLTDIQQDQRDSVKDKYRRVLQLWARRKQSRWEDVIEQLQEIGLSQLADDLTKELEISQPSPPVPVDYGSRSKPGNHIALLGCSYISWPAASITKSFLLPLYRGT